jgi:two-component system chemotaxis sensor kinase CheA
VRNSLDHGLEKPDVRAAAGKSRTGTICLQAQQEGDQIVISVADDGAGIDPERIARKAVEKGLVTAERARTLNTREIFDFIFLPGFSTAEQISDISGRGVGMDVVRSNLKKMNGVIDVDSKVGKGTTVCLRLPLTLAILPVLLVEVAHEIFALPLRSVIETARVREEEVHLVEGSEVLRLREDTLPLIRLSRMFESKSNGNCPGDKVVVLGIGEKRIAVLVDHLVGQESTVIKPLGSYLHNCSNLAGAPDKELRDGFNFRNSTPFRRSASRTSRRASGPHPGLDLSGRWHLSARQQIPHAGRPLRKADAGAGGQFLQGLLRVLDGQAHSPGGTGGAAE